MTRMNFLNTEIDNLTFDEALEKADQLIQNHQFNYVVTPNVDHIVQLEDNSQFQSAYQEAALILTDGKPLIWISKILGTPIKEKISGSDFFPSLVELSAKKGYRIFLLGAKEGVAELAKKNLELKFPGVVISGYYSPPFGFEKNERELIKIEEIVNNSNSDILAVGLGAPKQELFLYNCWKRRKLNIKLALGIGATIDFEAGNVKRAPKWMQSYGFEWLYRLLQEPDRMFGRYWNDAKKIIPIIKKYK